MLALRVCSTDLNCPFLLDSGQFCVRNRGWGLGAALAGSSRAEPLTHSHLCIHSDRGRLFRALSGKAGSFLGSGGRRHPLACVLSPPSQLPAKELWHLIRPGSAGVCA